MAQEYPLLIFPEPQTLNRIGRPIPPRKFIIHHMKDRLNVYLLYFEH